MHLNEKSAATHLQPSSSAGVAAAATPDRIRRRPARGRCLPALAAALLAAGCGGKERGTSTEPHRVGGTVAGLVGSGLLLRDGAGGEIAVTGNGHFVFPTTIANGNPYSVEVATQPGTPSQTCIVSGGAGTVAEADVSVLVTCSTNDYAIRGRVIGLVGSGLVLGALGEANVTVEPAAPAFTFGTRVESGNFYVVSVVTQPSSPAQTCTVMTAPGTVDDADVDVTVRCVTNSYWIGGTVTSLLGSGLVLGTSGAPNLTVPAGATSFRFATKAMSGVPYNARVVTQPTGPAQTCTLTNQSGTVGNADVTSIAVSCTVNRYGVYGHVIGLTGTGLSLLATTWSAGAGFTKTTVPLDANTTGFVLPTRVESGGIYSVSVATQPEGHTCTLINDGGVVGTSDAVSLGVLCKALPAQSRFLYISDWNSAISEFRLDPDTGVPTTIGQVASPYQTSWEYFDPSGKHFYGFAANGGLWIYDVDTVTGQLTKTGEVATLEYPNTIRFDSTGTRAWLSHNSGAVWIFSVNPATGALTKTGETSTGCWGNWNFSVHRSGRFAYTPCDDGYVAGFSVDQVTGALTRTGRYDTGDDPSRMILHPSGKFVFVLCNMWGHYINSFTINQDDGTLTMVGNPWDNSLSTANSFTMDPLGMFVFAPGFDQTLSAWSVNPVTGKLATVAQTTTGRSNQAIAIDASGKYLYMLTQNSILWTHSFDRSTATFTTVGEPLSTGTAREFLTTSFLSP